MQKSLNKIADRKFLQRALFLLLFALTASTQSWAKLTATADRTVLDSNETLQLLVRFDGQALTSQPDFDVLERDFRILSNNRQQQYSISNGRTESFTDWKLTLAPKRIGRLLVPSIKYKNDISDAIEISVRKASPSNVTGQPVYTETLIDKPAVYVQEQLLLTHRLYTSIQLTDFSMEELKVPGAIIQKVAQNQFRKRVGNKDYIVVEIKYALFPQTSGKLDIPPVAISAYQVDNNQRSFFRSRGNQVIRNTDAKTIDVMAKPAHIDADQWMPSSQLTISQKWSNNLEQLQVGEPVTRTITISARGLTGAQILPLTLDASSDFKVYPDQAQINESVEASGVTGVRQESLALVPNRSGEIILPEISLRWWDTVNQRMQTATLDAMRLEVGAAPSNAATESVPYLEPIGMADNQQSIAGISEDPDLQESDGSISTLMKVSLGANALLLTLLAALLLKRQQRPSTRDHSINNLVNSPRLKLKQLIKAIEIDAKDEDLAAVREGILDWGRSAFPDHKIKTLQEIAELCADPQLKQQFDLLDHSLYNSNSSADQAPTVDIKLLIALLKGLDIPSAEAKTSANGLKPLYPTNNIG
ncbi:MAG: BatD family protein [Porticoccaceae bacterium]|nr:BatD family protein [Porticoccaceae bacterium]